MWLEQKNVKKAGDFDLVLINADLFKLDLSHNAIAYTRGRTFHQDKIKEKYQLVQKKKVLKPSVL